jgi:tetratricopeptide (TPR) repeat protein
MKNVICLLIVLSLCWPVLAFRITPELQKELNQKTAAVKNSPKDPAARFDLAITQAYTNNLIDGMFTIKKIGELDLNYKTRALKEYIEKVKQNPNDWRLRFRLAFVYYFNEKYQDAIREFENVIKLDPDNVFAYGYLALLEGGLGNVDKAIELTKKGISLDSNVAALHLLLSEGYYKKGDSWGGWLERMEALRLKALGY